MGTSDEELTIENEWTDAIPILTRLHIDELREAAFDLRKNGVKISRADVIETLVKQALYAYRQLSEDDISSLNRRVHDMIDSKVCGLVEMVDREVTIKKLRIIPSDEGPPSKLSLIVSYGEEGIEINMSPAVSPEKVEPFFRALSRTLTATRARKNPPVDGEGT